MSLIPPYVTVKIPEMINICVQRVLNTVKTVKGHGYTCVDYW